MNKKLILVIFMLLHISLFAKTDFPVGWDNENVFVKVNTKLSNLKNFPSCNKNFSGFPLIYQDLFNTFCKFGDEKGLGKIDILVNNKSIYFDKNIVLNDTIIILRVKQLKLLLVTEFKEGIPHYDVWTEDGKRASNQVENSPLNPNECMRCHNIYSEKCVNGICGKILKRRFQ